MPRSIEEQRWFLLSLGLHALAILLAYVTLPHLLKPIELPAQVIPIDVVDVGEITNTRTQQQQPTPPKPQPKPETPKPPVPAPPPPKAAAQAAPPAPPEPKQAEESLPDVIKKLQQQKPPPKPQEAKQAQLQNQMDSMLKNVAKLQPTETPDNTVHLKKPPDDASDQSNPSPVLSNQLTISQMDALRRQIAGCWNVPIGARDAQNMTVQIHIEVNPDRTIRSAEIVDRARVQSDSFFRAMAESAMRALYNPHCSPLLLPPDQYNDWHSITFNFDPRAMLF